MALVCSLPSTQDPGNGPFLSRTNQFHTLSSYVFNEHFNIILPHTTAFPRKPAHVFPSEFLFLTVKKYNFVFKWCWFHLTILSMNFEEWKLWNPLLCSFLWPPGNLRVIGQNIPLISLFSTIHSEFFSFCHRSVCRNLLLLSGLHNNTVMNTRFACHANLIKKTEVVDLLTLQ